MYPLFTLLKIIRKSKDYRRTALAEYLGLSDNQVKRLENDPAFFEINLKVLTDWLDFLEFSPSELKSTKQLFYRQRLFFHIKKAVPSSEFTTIVTDLISLENQLPKDTKEKIKAALIKQFIPLIPKQANAIVEAIHTLAADPVTHSKP